MLYRAKLPLLLLALTFPVMAGADCMGPYPPSMVKAFTQNCATDPKLTPFCGCVMDGVQKTIPLADFIETGNSAGGINNDPRFMKASKQCSSLLPGAPAATAPAQTPAKTPAQTTSGVKFQ